MRDESHAGRVDAWLARAERPLAPEALLRRFEATLEALWAQTQNTLGEVTLCAIAERVLSIAADKFPFLSALKVDPTRGIQCDQLLERLGAVPGPELKDGLRFVLVELLTVLGNLTAEILTPELHAVLDRLAKPGGVRGAKARKPHPFDPPKTRRES